MLSANKDVLSFLVVSTIWNVFADCFCYILFCHSISETLHQGNGTVFWSFPFTPVKNGVHIHSVCSKRSLEAMLCNAVCKLFSRCNIFVKIFTATDLWNAVYNAPLLSLCIASRVYTHDRKLNYCRLYWYSGLLRCHFDLEPVLPGQTVIIAMKSYPLRNIWKATLQDIIPTLPLSVLIIKHTMLLYNPAWSSRFTRPRLLSSIPQFPASFGIQTTPEVIKSTF